MQNEEEGRVLNHEGWGVESSRREQEFERKGSIHFPNSFIGQPNNSLALPKDGRKLSAPQKAGASSIITLSLRLVSARKLLKLRSQLNESFRKFEWERHQPSQQSRFEQQLTADCLNF